MKNSITRGTWITIKPDPLDKEFRTPLHPHKTALIVRCFRYVFPRSTKSRMHYKAFVFDHKGRYNELVDLERSEFAIARVKPAFHKNIVLLPDLCRPFTNAYRINVTDLYHMDQREELPFDGFVDVAKGRMYLGAMAVDLKQITKALKRLQ